jgi:hypothetical protein
MVLGVLVLVFPDWGVSTLVVLLSFGLMSAGFRSISLVGYSDLSSGVRAVSAITGIISLILALFVFIFPGFGALTLIILVSSSLLVYGYATYHASNGRGHFCFFSCGICGWRDQLIQLLSIFRTSKTHSAYFSALNFLPFNGLR